ncbi:MAG: LacI family DNA-binding transcriptional regulator [Acidobacteriaceae bacterium]
MPVTIRDVAKQLNLSITTVSRALDGYPDVSAVTRQRVMQVAHELGYIPNRAARQLRRKRTDTIGYILPSNAIHPSSGLISEFISGMVEAAAAKQYDLLISSALESGEAEQQLYQRWVCERRVDGFILDRVRQADWRIKYLAQEKVPFASLERSTDDQDYPSVHLDYLSCVSGLVGHLVGQGFKRIAFMGSTDDLVIHSDKFEGYRLGLIANHMTVDPSLVVQAEQTSTGGYQAAKKLQSMPRPPTAIICVYDEPVTGIVRAAYDAHLRVGQDLAVVVFDGAQSSQRAQPALTSVDQPVVEIAQQLVRMLLAEINATSLPVRQAVIQPVLRFGVLPGKGGIK